MPDTKSREQIDPFGRIGGQRPSLLDAQRRAHFAATAHEDIPDFVAVHKAWVVMLVRQNIVEARRGAAILEALNAVDAAAIDEMIAAWHPSGWEPMIQLERHLTARIGQIASDVNIGRTIPPPFYRMRLRCLALELIEQSILFRGLLLRRALEHAETVMPGYTHLQHAQPMTFGHYLLGLYEAVDRAGGQLEAAYASTNRFDLGCGALAGTSFAIDRQLPADLLGFDGLLEHTNDGVAATDHAVDLLAASANLMIPLSRVANELDIWSSLEFDFVEVADHLANPSSMMPQKKNPAMFEFCRMSLGQVLGGFSEVLCGSHGVPYGDVIEMRELSFRLCPILRTVTEQLRIMGETIDSLLVKKDRMLRRAREGFSTVTELVAVLYRETGIPLRRAHGVVAEVVRMLLAEGKLATDTTPEVVEQASRKILGEPIRLKRQTLVSCLDPVEFVRAHDSQGGVAPAEVRRMIAQREPGLQATRLRQCERRRRLQEAAARLQAAVEEVAGGCRP